MALIEIQHLTKVFGTGADRVTALEDVSLRVEDGDIFGIIGMSGAGKSTLLRCLSMLEKPTSGQIVLDGSDLAAMNGAQLRAERRKMGVVFQGYNLLMQKTVAENVAFPLKLEKGFDKAAVAARVDELLELVGLADKAGAYPAQLSGGQKQRVAVAVSMICGKDLLVFDEPTSGLDFDSMTQVAGLIRRLSELGKVIFIVTHDFEFVCRTCSRVLHFDEGEMPDDIPVVMDALPKLRELFSVSDGKER